MTALKMKERSIWILPSLILAIAALWNHGGVTTVMKRFLEEEEEEEEAEEVEPVVLASVVACIVLFLIVVTILFELGKEHIEEHANNRVKPIIEKLFGEMTILGFLALLTYVISRMGFFEVISLQIFSEEDALLEIFELIHFTVFFVMIFFVVQVLMLVQKALEIQSRWTTMERKIVAASKTQPQEPTSGSSSAPLHEKDMEFKVYKALRTEFLLDRSFEPPFQPKAELEDNFSFDSYLGHCLGAILSHVVQVHPPTWLFYAAVTVLFYGFFVLFSETDMILVWSWVGFGWLVFGFNVALEEHLAQLLLTLAPQGRDTSTPSESTGLMEGGDGSLPPWCYADTTEPRPLLERLFVRSKPNRQQSFYWMGRKGPQFYTWILQINLLFIGIYCSFFILHCYGQVKETENVFFLCVYIVLAVIPMVGIIATKDRVVGTLALVSSLGCYRRPQTIRKVLMEEKTADVVNVFFLLYKLNLCAENYAKEAEHHETNHSHRVLEHWEIDRVTRSFQALDKNGNGQLSQSELAALLEALGARVPPETIGAMVNTLDRSHNDGISLDEFLSWYSAKSSDHHMSSHARAEYFFRMFDSDDSGALTIEEFKRKLDALEMGFTLDEIGQVVNELDEDNSGTISAHEFAHLLHKYAPEGTSSGHDEGEHHHHHHHH